MNKRGDRVGGSSGLAQVFQKAAMAILLFGALPLLVHAAPIFCSEFDFSTCLFNSSNGPFDCSDQAGFSGTPSCRQYSSGLCSGQTDGTPDYSPCTPPNGFQGNLSISPNGGNFMLSSPPSVSYTYSDTVPQTGGSWTIYYREGSGCPINTATNTDVTRLGTHSVPMAGASCGMGKYQIQINAQDVGGDSGNVVADFYLQSFVQLNFVVRDASNIPIPGVIVTISPSFAGTCQSGTDGSGFCNYGVLSTANYSYTATRSGYNSVNGSLRVGTADVTRNITMASSCNPNCGCAANTPVGQSCSDGCGGSCPGTVQSPTITSPLSDSGSVGSSFIYTITATNNPSSFNATGLPAGLALSGAVISGIPSASGSFNIDLTASNIAGTGTSATLLLNISAAPQPPTINSPLAASGVLGSAFTYTISATHNPSSFDATGLPAGLALSGAVISGIPSAAVTSNITLTATNGAGTSAPATLVLAVSLNTQPPVITQQPANQNVIVGQTAAFTIAATGAPSPTYQWRRNGTDIPGATGTSYTTPATALTDSGAVFTCAVSNMIGAPVISNPATLTVTPCGPGGCPTPPPVVNSPTTATGVVGTPFTYQITATNTPTIYGVTGLVPGLSFNATTGRITGTPTSAVTAVMTVSATNGGGTGTRAVTVSINPQPPTPAAAPLLTSAFAYPSPYKPSVHGNGITFNNLGNDPTVVIKIYTIKGELVQELRNTGSAAALQWLPVANRSSEAVASGVYVYRIKSNTDEKTGKLIIAR